MKALALAALLLVATAAPALASDRQEHRLEVLQHRMDRLQLAFVMEWPPAERLRAIRRWAIAELPPRATNDRPHRWRRFAVAAYLWTDYALWLERRDRVRFLHLRQRDTLRVAMRERFLEWRYP